MVPVAPQDITQIESKTNKQICRRYGKSYGVAHIVGRQTAPFNVSMMR